jgi:ABC-2 type transport system ATP-binding protein
VIEVRNLSKNYGVHKAVSDVNFSIENNRIYGFLGPNGAGKTTIMNIMTGCLAASSGQVLIDGFDIFDDPEKAKLRLGYVPEQPPLYPDMSPLSF